jgi:hypothetical protein
MDTTFFDVRPLTGAGRLRFRALAILAPQLQGRYYRKKNDQYPGNFLLGHSLPIVSTAFSRGQTESSKLGDE